MAQLVEDEGIEITQPGGAGTDVFVKSKVGDHLIFNPEDWSDIRS